MCSSDLEPIPTHPNPCEPIPINPNPCQPISTHPNLWTALHAISHISSERELQGGTRLLPSVILEDIAVSAG